jgi:hypothetical protein
LRADERGDADGIGQGWHDLIDFKAGGIAAGEPTIEDAGWNLFRLILEAAADWAVKRLRGARPCRTCHAED